MDDSRAQFIIAFGDLCRAAALGGIPVGVTLTDGRRVAGVPQELRLATGEDELDDTGCPHTLRLGDQVVHYADVVNCTFCAPPHRQTGDRRALGGGSG